MVLLRRWLWSFCYNVMFYGCSQSEASFSVLTNQRPVIRRADQTETWPLLAIRGQSLTQCYCQSPEWGQLGERGGSELDVIYLMSLTYFSQVTKRKCMRGVLMCCVTAPAFVWYLLTTPRAPGAWWPGDKLGANTSDVPSTPGSLVTFQVL